VEKFREPFPQKKDLYYSALPTQAVATLSNSSGIHITDRGKVINGDVR